MRMSMSMCRLFHDWYLTKQLLDLELYTISPLLSFPSNEDDFHFVDANFELAGVLIRNS